MRGAERCHPVYPVCDSNGEAAVTPMGVLGSGLPPPSVWAGGSAMHHGSVWHPWGSPRRMPPFGDPLMMGTGGPFTRPLPAPWNAAAPWKSHPGIWQPGVGGPSDPTTHGWGFGVSPVTPRPQPALGVTEGLMLHLGAIHHPVPTWQLPVPWDLPSIPYLGPAIPEGSCLPPIIGTSWGVASPSRHPLPHSTGATGPWGFGASGAITVPHGRREGRGGPALLGQNLPEALHPFGGAGWDLGVPIDPPKHWGGGYWCWVLLPDSIRIPPAQHP